VAKNGIFHSFKNKKKFKQKVDRLETVSIKHAQAALIDSTLLIHNVAIKLIQTKSPGKQVMRYGGGGAKKRLVTASSPGEAPNTDTGRLIKSVKFEINKKGLNSKVGTNLKYGAALELGTKKMAPRPWLSTAFKMSKKEVTKIFERYYKDAVKKVAGEK